MEYETQFRIEPNDVSSALWKRRDAILDDNPIGGGMATPIADGIIALQIEAFDGIFLGFLNGTPMRWESHTQFAFPSLQLE